MVLLTVHDFMSSHGFLFERWVDEDVSIHKANVNAREAVLHHFEDVQKLTWESTWELEGIGSVFSSDRFAFLFS